MKVIDLLNKIANGEEVPKKIKYLTTIYTLRSNLNYYEEDKGSNFKNGISSLLVSKKIKTPA